jgi:hypothetical protein
MATEMKGAPISFMLGQRLARWGALLEIIAGDLSEVLSRTKYVLIILFTIAYLFQTCYFAHRKLFWFDELFTVYISRLPDLSSMWHVLSEGVDFNPPLVYALTRVSVLLLGEGQVTVRLPAIVGFGVFCLCLFRFVSIRSSILGGYVSMLFPLVTGAYWYAYEARPYGALLGFCGVALICWQGATMQSERRWFWLTGLAGALACAMLIHSYAVLLFLPIGFGELARSVRLRRVDWPVWVAIIVPSAAMLPSLTLLHNAQSNLNVQGFFQPTLPKLAAAYVSYLAPATGVLSGAFVLMLVSRMSRPANVTQLTHVAKHQLHEFVALFVFVAIPVFAYLAAKITGAPFLSRYGISCIAGFAGLLGIALARRPPIAIGVLFLLVTQIGIGFIQFKRNSFILEPSTSLALSTSAPDFMQRYTQMASVQDNESPIVLLDDLEFLPTFYYAPVGVASRLTHLVDPKTDPNSPGFLMLRKCCNAAGNAPYLSDFLSSHDRFLAYGGPRSAGWLNYYRIRAGATVIVERMSGTDFLVSVTITKKEGLAQ